jgi:hypothetical protein
MKDHDHLVTERSQFLGYCHLDYHEDIALKIIDMLPMSDLFTFNKERLAIFETPPGGGCGIHKDGIKCLTSFNIVLEAHDDLCETTFYNNDQVGGTPRGLPYVRNIFSDYSQLEQFTPIKRMVAKQGEIILFNPNRWHAWQNIKSPHRRRVVTIRLTDTASVTFKDMKKKLFLT